ncbi:ScbR family autoregulator-binding transcription factor [Streptomyces beihaiensis]|uniref:ScbR family autoregulator-binding transcription factor n=1 Tax=Streptomyces beihaiensis TaxID=2984495 RepID=A0ABT3U3P0_9ACTN|nr:ScbR family autoregulator-binding transcription factor [Streptomyces beihaiensis]MCX3063660.1 ScbR family autoregulator-binding transcription factor [Streptomyces beihaiensis]
MVKQQRSQRTMERLVAAAAQEFAAQGFARASLADVSRRAGVTKGALFFHFSTKDELAEAVQMRAQDLLDTAIEEHSQVGVSSMQVLVDITHYLNGVLHEDPYIRASVRISREQANGDPSAYDFYSLWFGRLWRLLELARRRGELGRAVADVSARTLVTAAVSGVETLAWMGTGRGEVEQWLGHLWELMLPLLLTDDLGEEVRAEAPPDLS